jgi:hypothetical protein
VASATPEISSSTGASDSGTAVTVIRAGCEKLETNKSTLQTALIRPMQKIPTIFPPCAAGEGGWQGCQG